MHFSSRISSFHCGHWVCDSAGTSGWNLIPHCDSPKEMQAARHTHTHTQMQTPTNTQTHTPPTCGSIPLILSSEISSHVCAHMLRPSTVMTWQWWSICLKYLNAMSLLFLFFTHWAHARLHVDFGAMRSSWLWVMTIGSKAVIKSRYKIQFCGECILSKHWLPVTC